MNLISAAEMVLDWWHEWRDEPPEPEEAVAFEALQAALSGEADRVKQLEEALRPLKAIADAVFIDRDGREANSSKRDDDGLWGFDGTTITYGDLRRIRALLNGGSNERD